MSHTPTDSLNLTIATDPHQIATDLLQEARDQLRSAENWGGKEEIAERQAALTFAKGEG